jgi:hypothetical protein
VEWVLSTRTTINTSLIGTMKSCVVLKSTLQQLQDGLLEKGSVLKVLLKADFPDADAVLVAVENIKFLLGDHPVDISDQLVTARVVVGDKKEFISNLPVRKVSILLLFCIYCA